MVCVGSGSRKEDTPSSVAPPFSSQLAVSLLKSRQSEGDGAARHLTPTAVEGGAWEAATRSSSDGGGPS
ncbi:hypothetical protein CDL15_Pgr012926 [Punica granatum]|uniref:Uncharacterized protein n=1 Tax=Punica granatum TaxID=22663 RepID=A0A218XE18_PUNGR|nr:hypothetical protein CDL15_Pgr012926 [Punica granatum]